MGFVRTVGALLLPLAIGSCQLFLAGEPPAIDLHAYGVEGDGISDDTRAFQQAILDAEARGVALQVPTPRAYYLVYLPLVVTNARLTGSGAEIRNPVGPVLRVEGPAHVSGLTLVGRNGLEVYGGTFENLTVRAGSDTTSNGDGWAVNVPAGTGTAGAVIRHSTLIGRGRDGTFAVGVLESGTLTLEDDSVDGTRWGVYVRGRSTLLAARTAVVGFMIGFELDRTPQGYPGGDKYGTTDIVFTDCTINTLPGGPRWDVAVPFLAGLGHVVFAGTINELNILNSYAGPVGDPPVGPPIGTMSDIIQRR